MYVRLILLYLILIFILIIITVVVVVVVVVGKRKIFLGDFHLHFSLMNTITNAVKLLPIPRENKAF